LNSILAAASPTSSTLAAFTETRHASSARLACVKAPLPIKPVYSLRSPAVGSTPTTLR
jgi:hypothetical protein